FIKSPVLCCGENITFHQVAKFSVPLQSTDLQASIVLAFQSLFEAKGVPMEYDEVMAYIMLNAADQFERITGELPVIVH
ncbi:hypothetical protein OU670_23390, partial [Escherichia coli]|nr:hypothetical protein [Escherichia coli]